MKILVLGDIHGRDIWKTILNKEDPKKVIFVGDYLDSFDVEQVKQVSNFKDIVAYKRSDPDNVTLLLGNHDYHYIESVREKYGGYSSLVGLFVEHALRSLINDQMIQICCKVEGYVISHAGIGAHWLDNVGLDDEDEDKIIDNINEALYTNLDIFRFRKGKNGSNTGNDTTQGPLWIRPPSLGVSARFKNQIVGHTEISRINTMNNYVLIDTLGTSQEYIILEDGKIKVGRV